LPGNARMTDRLQNFGYYEIEAQEANMLCDTGGKINAHFFHHSVSDFEGDSFLAVKKTGKSFPCIVAAKDIFAGYQHLHFGGNPDFARRFIKACWEYRGGLK
jgi:cobyrinic acid a,c-diamide synthase